MDLLVTMKKLRFGKTRTQNRNDGGTIPGPLVLNGESRCQPIIGALVVVYHWTALYASETLNGSITGVLAFTAQSL